jgi:hypothetical protein
LKQTAQTSGAVIGLWRRDPPTDSRSTGRTLTTQSSVSRSRYTPVPTSAEQRPHCGLSCAMRERSHYHRLSPQANRTPSKGQLLLRVGPAGVATYKLHIYCRFSSLQPELSPPMRCVRRCSLVHAAPPAAHRRRFAGERPGAERYGGGAHGEPDLTETRIPA